MWQIICIWRILTFGTTAELVGFGSHNLTQEQLLVSVKHQMTHMYLQYSCFVLNSFYDMFYANCIIHILLKTLHMNPNGIW